ncbi:hypothetical protein K449DRAFT_419279 [Hypoxylon sp. EC38]|nr:hypothetical protein K449DRAFT_419279 [Hypoxylon sp. EC38]
MACDQEYSDAESEQCTQQHVGVVGIETFKRRFAQEMVSASLTSIENPCPAVEVNAARPSPLRVAPACDQQLDCNREKSADRFPLNRDVPKEDQNHADHTRSYSMASYTSQPKFSRADQDEDSSEMHQSSGLASWWETIAPTDLHDPGDVTAEEDWSGAISTPYEYDRSNAINGQFEGWRVDEDLDILFIYPYPEDLIYGLEEATAAWLGGYSTTWASQSAFHTAKYAPIREDNRIRAFFETQHRLDTVPKTARSWRKQIHTNTPRQEHWAQRPRLSPIYNGKPSSLRTMLH